MIATTFTASRRKAHESPWRPPAILPALGLDSPLGFKGNDANLYRYVGNNAINSSDPSGLVEDPPGVPEMNVYSPFEKRDPSATGKEILKLAAKISEGELTIKVLEGTAFDQKARKEHGFEFRSVVAGSIEQMDSNRGLKDTDSVQVAVRWSSETETDVGHDSNAKPPGLRKVGAIWTFGVEEPKHEGEASKEWATWPTKVPKGATRVEVIIVYTDIITGTPAATSKGDVPIIIGSFSGKQTNREWTIKANTNDAFDPNRDPQLTQQRNFKGIFEKANDILTKRTGYVLRARPNGLTFEFSREAYENNGKIINAAVKREDINGGSDTGFDMVWPGSN